MKYFILSLLICTSTYNFGQSTYTFTLDDDSVKYGASGSTLMIFGKLKNTGPISVVIDVIRVQNDLPSGWQSSICTDICYPPTQDSTMIQILAGDSSYFDFSFYSTSVDTGFATVLVRNQGTPTSNVYLQQFLGITTLTGVMEVTALKPRIELFPNPTSSRLSIDMDEEINKVMIYTLNGKLVQTAFNASFSIEQLPQGTYLINVETENGIAKSKFVRID